MRTVAACWLWQRKLISFIVRSLYRAGWKVMGARWWHTDTTVIALISVDSFPHCSAIGTHSDSNISIETKKSAEESTYRSNQIYKDATLIDKHRKKLLKRTEEMFSGEPCWSADKRTMQITNKRIFCPTIRNRSFYSNARSIINKEASPADLRPWDNKYHFTRSGITVPWSSSSSRARKPSAPFILVPAQ